MLFIDVIKYHALKHCVLTIIYNVNQQWCSCRIDPASIAERDRHDSSNWYPRARWKIRNRTSYGRYAGSDKYTNAADKA